MEHRQVRVALSTGALGEAAQVTHGRCFMVASEDLLTHYDVKKIYLGLLRRNRHFALDMLLTTIELKFRNAKVLRNSA